jgi:tRNA A-37 threonylcarbamoyl transferase component Bud32
MMDAPTLELGSTLAGKYKIVRVLGAGGMGAVYLAENLAIARQVAIKVLHARMGRDAATLHRFRQEAKATATIGHPGVVDVLDMGETDAGEAFIVMEKLEGETMGARLKQRHRLSVDETISIVTEALDAIAAAHDKGIVHRDLKPDNLFLVWHPRWCVKILDFGISRFIDSDEIRVTASNTVMGSVLYMPPEQARDARSAGPTADLYALGAVMYHALTGRPPFGGESYSEVLSRVLTDAPESITALRPDLPPALAELVMALLAKAPVDRPKPARVVRDRLRAMVPAVVPPAEPPAAADALGATMESVDRGAPTGAALAPTAASGPPLAVTAASQPPAPTFAIGATTGVAAGEVSLAPHRAKRPAWLVPVVALAVAAAGVTAFIAVRQHDDRGVAPDASAVRADTILVERTIDAGPDAAIRSDAGPIIDVRADAAIVRSDASTRKVRSDARAAGNSDAAPTRPDAYQPLQLQDIPP